jgi:Flp pilus assembly protein TadD
VPAVGAHFPRLLFRVSALGPSFYAITARDRSYVTDLRMRRSSDPELFFTGNARKIIVSAPNVWRGIYGDDAVTVALRDERCRQIDVAKEVENWTDDPDLWGQLLCCYADCFGDWEDARAIGELIAGRAYSFEPGRDQAWLVELAATLRALDGEGSCEPLYERALALALDAYQKFLVHLRKATAELKRLGATNRAVESLRLAEATIKTFAESGYTRHDEHYALALVRNLTALAYSREMDVLAARSHLEVASQLLERVDGRASITPEHLVERYRVTILQNQGLLAAYSHSWAPAIDYFQRALRYAEEHDSDSIAECLSYLGYALLRLNRLDSARNVLIRAEALLAEDVSPIRLSNVRGLLAAIGYRSHDAHDAKHWLHADDHIAESMGCALAKASRG